MRGAVDGGMRFDLDAVNAALRKIAAKYPGSIVRKTRY